MFDGGRRLEVEDGADEARACRGASVVDRGVGAVGDGEVAVEVVRGQEDGDVLEEGWCVGSGRAGCREGPRELAVAGDLDGDL